MSSDTTSPRNLGIRLPSETASNPGKAKQPIKCDIVCTVHRNQFYKQTNKMHFLYVFILQFSTTLHVSNYHFVHHQEFMIYCILQLCTNRANLPNCCLTVGSNRKTAVRHVCAPDGERNGHSKHVELYKNCRINTFIQKVHLVGLFI